MEYWLEIEAVVSGAPNILDVSRVCNPQNDRGIGIWVLSVAGGDTMVSYSGPRDVTDDIDYKRYTMSGSLEEALGDSSWPNIERSLFTLSLYNPG
jgi:hypothetical protein